MGLVMSISQGIILPNQKSKTQKPKEKNKRKEEDVGAKELKNCFWGYVFVFGEQCNTILKSMVVCFPTASVLVKCLKI